MSGDLPDPGALDPLNPKPYYQQDEFGNFHVVLPPSRPASPIAGASPTPAGALTPGPITIMQDPLLIAAIKAMPAAT